jgi:hypothetical protein
VPLEICAEKGLQIAWCAVTRDGQPQSVGPLDAVRLPTRLTAPAPRMYSPFSDLHILISVGDGCASTAVACPRYMSCAKSRRGCPWKWNVVDDNSKWSDHVNIQRSTIAEQQQFHILPSPTTTGALIAM